MNDRSSIDRRERDDALPGPDASQEARSFRAERAALARERAELERPRADMLSTVSHAPRTPLTLIRTSVGLLLESDADAVMRARLLRGIRQSAERMRRLADEVLDPVRLESGRAELQLRFLDVGELVAAAASLMHLPLARVWGREYVEEIDYVRVYVRPPRREIGDDPENPRQILAERGTGYRFRGS